MATPYQQAAQSLTDLADTLAEIRAVLDQHSKAGRDVVRLDLVTDVEDDADLLKQLLTAVEMA